MADKIKFKKGVQSAYTSATKDQFTLYYITDANELYLGDIKIANWSTVKNASFNSTTEKITFTKDDNTTFDVDLSGYFKEADIDTTVGENPVDTKVPSTKAVKTYVDSKTSSVYRFKGSKDTTAEIKAITDAEIGDVWNAKDTGMNWAWTGTEWDSLGGVVDTAETTDNKLKDGTGDTIEANKTSTDKYTSAKSVVTYITAQLEPYFKTENIITTIDDTTATSNDKVAGAKATKDYVDTQISNLSTTYQTIANLSTSTSIDNTSDTTYPSSKSVGTDITTYGKNFIQTIETDPTTTSGNANLKATYTAATGTDKGGKYTLTLEWLDI